MMATNFYFKSEVNEARARLEKDKEIFYESTLLSSLFTSPELEIRNERERGKREALDVMKIVKQERSGERDKDLQKKLEGVKKFVIRMVNNNEKKLADLERNLMKLETIVDEAKKQKQEAEERLKQGKTIKSLSDMELEEAKSEIRRIENEMRDYIIYKGGAVIEILDLKRRLEAKDDNLETAMASKNDEITDLTEALESEVNENNERKKEIISLNKEITNIRTELDQANLEIK